MTSRTSVVRGRPPYFGAGMASAVLLVKDNVARLVVEVENFLGAIRRLPQFFFTGDNPLWGE